MKCPICNTTINDIKENLFCPVCHWELAALPTNALSLRGDYDYRFAVFHNSYDGFDTVDTLSKKIKNLKKGNEAIENELTKLKKDVKEKTYRFGQLEMEQISLQKAQRENSKKQKKLKEIEREIEIERNVIKDLLTLEEKVKELEKAYRYAFHRGFGYKLSVIKKFLEDYKKVNTWR